MTPERLQEIKDELDMFGAEYPYSYGCSSSSNADDDMKELIEALEKAKERIIYLENHCFHDTAFDTKMGLYCRVCSKVWGEDY